MIYLNTEIKTHTPFLMTKSHSYTVNNDTQIDKLRDIIDYVYWLSVENIKHPGSSIYSGIIYRMKGLDVYKYIQKIGYKDKTNKKLHMDKYGSTWLNIPLNEMKKVGQIDKSIMKDSGINGQGVSMYGRSEQLEWYRSGAKKDKNKMNTKGNTGEMLMRDYFNKQERVLKVEKPEDIYSSIDMILTIKEKDKAA